MQCRDTVGVVLGRVWPGRLGRCRRVCREWAALASRLPTRATAQPVLARAWRRRPSRRRPSRPTDDPKIAEVEARFPAELDDPETRDLHRRVAVRHVHREGLIGWTWFLCDCRCIMTIYPDRDAPAPTQCMIDGRRRRLDDRLLLNRLLAGATPGELREFVQCDVRV